MSKAEQITIGLMSLCWAESVLVLGLVLLVPRVSAGQSRVIGLAMIGAGFFLAMWLVIDRLVPDASRVFTGTLKLSAIVLFYICGVLTLYGA